MLNQISELNSFVVPQALPPSSTSAQPCCKAADSNPAACPQSAAGQKRRGQPTCAGKPQKVISRFKKASSAAVKCLAKRLGASSSTVFKQSSSKSYLFISN